MKNHSDLDNRVSSCVTRLLSVLVTAAALLVLPVAGFTQETTSVIRGVVSAPDGSPIPGASVRVTDTRTGRYQVASTGSTGRYQVGNMIVGGPYTVTVDAPNTATQTVTDVYLTLGETYELNLALSPAQIEEIVVTASMMETAQVAVGPSATFGLAQLESAPAINRNIADVVRSDPRLYVDESRGDINAVQCAGKNSRYNSLTVDGVRMNDSFGLNSNGYPTERMPFSYDAISQVAVELAPFDVEYGGFSACNINAVTKSGRNEFFGSVFYDYTNDNLRGDKLEGQTVRSGSYDEKRYGITVGGPVVQDKLFFFVAYEKLDGANLFDRGIVGSGAVNEVPVTQAEIDQIVNISKTVYLYDPGYIPSSLDHQDEKFLAKVDWNITEDHRLAFTYTYNDGDNFTESDSDQFSELEFSNHLYERGAKLDSYVANLYSSWNDRFSTEVRVSYLKLDNRQISVGGTDVGEIRVELRNRPGLGNVDVYLGGDDSRQSNKLKYDVTSFALKGYYDLDNGHNLTFGVEQEALDIFNLFVQHTETELRFNSIVDFQNGLADDVYYNNAPSQNPNDAAANWGYDVNTVYIQDEFDLADRWTIVAGLRYDWYKTSDAPPLNPAFLADYGFPNTATVDGEGLVQPRVGFTYELSDATTIFGGVGRYSGGNPNVWLSNNYSANNVTQFGAYRADFDLFNPAITYEALEPNAPAGAGPGWGIPSPLYDDISAGMGSNFEINYLDPNFKLPSEWKFAVGVTHVFPGEWIVSGDLLYTLGEDLPLVLHGDLDRVGTNPDGYPQYASTREASFVLTNSNTTAKSLAASVALSKAFDNGFDFTVGYAYSDAEDPQPMTSSVAFSNYNNRAFFDPQEDIESTSNYNIKHRFTATANWHYDIADRFPLTVSVYGHANSGIPYSYTYDGVVVPYGFTPFLDAGPAGNVLEPGDKRNAQYGSWWRKIDLRAELGMPGFTEGDTASVFLVIDNFTNLLNDSWGILKQYDFPFNVTKGAPEPRIGDASRYEIRFGVRYAFN